MVSYTGSCSCGLVSFSMDGIAMPSYCHCRACGRAHGISPVQVALVKEENFKVLQGEELIVESTSGKMSYRFCGKCGCAVYQWQIGQSYRSTFPATYHIESPDGITYKLPKELQPVMHVNYENRLLDWHDDVVKYKCFPPGPKMNNAGGILPEEQ